MPTFADAVRDGGLVLDGGLGTLLEARGHDLSSELWSARLLLERPEAIRAAHREFFDAGASVAISASYQVSFESLERAGLSAADTERALRRSVELAAEAREGVAGDRFVAASVGPYGAMLADGSEYRGDYGLSVDELRRWHRRRIAVLAASGADVLAVETIPSVAEVEAIAAEVAGAGAPAWVSVTIGMGTLRSGEDLSEAWAILRETDEIVAVGVNCSDPLEVTAAVESARELSGKPVIAYPNSGERWDAKNRVWTGHAEFPDRLVRQWADAGAAGIGGCCRVGPAEVGRIRAALDAASALRPEPAA